MLTRLVSSTILTLSILAPLAMPATAAEIGQTVSNPCPFGDCGAQIALAYAGECVIPTGTVIDGVEIGGLSGLDFDPATGRFTAISDDRSEKAPARYYELAIDADGTGIHTVTVLKRITLQDKDGTPFAAKMVDLEAIRFSRIVWTSEGDAKRLLPPFVRELNADGSFRHDFAMPAGFAPVADKSAGIRDNLAFEGLTFLPRGDLIVGTEETLNQDGPIADLPHGGLSRLIRYDAASGQPKAEYAYTIAPIPPAPSEDRGWKDNGLSELLALDDHRLLAIERVFAKGFGFNITVYMLDLASTTDISGIASLSKAETRVVPVRGSLVMDMRAFCLTPDNIEGMTLAKGKDGSDLLIFVPDTNFSPEQKTQFHAFKVLKSPERGRRDAGIPNAWRLPEMPGGSTAPPPRR